MEDNRINEREISVRNLMWDYVVLWKPILFFSIICAIAFACVGGLRTKQEAAKEAAKKAAKEAENGFTEKEINDLIQTLRAKLSEQEVYDVERLVERDRLIYSINSIEEAGINALYEKQLSIIYGVETNDQPLNAVLELYRQYIENGDLQGILAPDIGYDLVNVEYSGSDNPGKGSFDVHIIVPESVQEGEWESNARKYLEQTAFSDVQMIIPHRLSHIGSKVNVVKDYELSNFLMDTAQDMYSYEGLYQRSEEGFNDDQKTLYSYLRKREGLER